jgi:hypothetical protein
MTQEITRDLVILRPPDATFRQLTTSQVIIQVAQVMLQIIERFALSPVIRIGLKVSKPCAVFFPTNESARFHSMSPYSPPYPLVSLRTTASEVRT